MSSDTATVNEQTPIDPSIYWERSGVLARASAQGAIFSLYLAMQQHSVAEPFEIEAITSDTENNNSIEERLASLNHYRRPSLAVNEGDWDRIHVLSTLVSQDYTTARLYLSMNPTPLSQTDNAKRLPNEVLDNCSLATQKRLKKYYANTVKEDNTLLYDILASRDEKSNTEQYNPQGSISFENNA